MVKTDSFVHIVDDDGDVLSSLEALLDAAGYRCIAYGSGRDFLAAAPSVSASCAVVDVRMPEMDGLALMVELARRSSRLPVILMTGFGDVPLAVRAMKAGAIDFIEKPYRFAELREAIDRALAISKADRSRFPIAEIEAGRLIARLTQRENEVFARLIVGDPNKAIARLLGISARTVEIHRARVMEKLAAKNIADLVRLSLSVTSPPDSDPIRTYG
jgi:two-component system response regulator FixJ